MFNGFVLTRMSREDMIVLVAENSESKVVSVGNVDKIVMSEKSVRSNGPSGLRFCEVSLVKRVFGKCRQDVRI
jgi:hypothetical protein